MASKCGVKLTVKQGEELNRLFTIKTNGEPMSLYGYTVRVQVKPSPLERVKSFIDKSITEVSDINEEGIINAPVQGQFTLHLTTKDTSLPVGEYYLVISLQQYKYNNIISSNDCGTAQFIVCEQ